MRMMSCCWTHGKRSEKASSPSPQTCFQAGYGFSWCYLSWISGWILSWPMTGFSYLETCKSCYLKYLYSMPVSKATSSWLGVNRGSESQGTIGKTHFRTSLCCHWQRRADSCVCTGPDASLTSNTFSPCRFSSGLAKPPMHRRGTRQLPQLRSISRPIQLGGTWQLPSSW